MQLSPTVGFSVLFLPCQILENEGFGTFVYPNSFHLFSKND